MSYESQLAIRSIYLNQATFTDIAGASILPISCNVILIVNDSGNIVFFRTDPANADSEVRIPDGATYTLGGPAIAGGFRFPVGLVNPVGALRSTVNGTSISIQSLQ